MSQSDTKTITDTNGQRGIIETMPASGSGANVPVTVRLESGQTLLVPLAVLSLQNDGSYRLPFALSEFLTSATAIAPSEPLQFKLAQSLTNSENVQPAFDATDNTEHQIRADMQTLESIVVPVVEEALSVGKRVVETGGTRINKTVHERQETVDIPLIEDHVEVERVPINRVIQEPVQVRREGETLIIPLFEEVLVVEKRLMLREELHVHMRREEVHKPQQVILRSEEVNIERFTHDTDNVASEPQSS